MRVLSADGVGEEAVELVLVDRAEQLLHRTRRVDDHQRRLRRYSEPGVDVAGVVAHLREGEAVLVDEALEGGVVTEPGDADEVDLAGPPFARCLDRGSFMIAGDSSRRPEPQRNSPPCVLSEVDRTTTDQRRTELQGLRHGCVRHVRTRCNRTRCNRTRCNRGCGRPSGIVATGHQEQTGDHHREHRTTHHR